jgi:betaine-homocysteine S-methyltransferase
MASGFMDRLKDGPVLGDGGYYLELERRCLGSFAKGVPWAVLDHPEGLLELHREFALAGAEVLQAMAWGVGKLDRDEELHRTAVELARQAAGPDRFVAGTLSPFGIGKYQRRSPITVKERREAQAFFERRVGQQIAAGVDLFIVETFYSVEEASLGLPYIKSAGVPAVVTLEYKSGEYTADRYLPDEAVKRLVDHGADVVGVNCGRPWYMYRDILRKMMGAVSMPSCAQPLAYVLENGAEYTREIASGSSVHFELRHQPRREMADYARDAWDMGVDFIGACCGALPYHIRAMAEAIGKPTEIPDRAGPYQLQ